MGKIIGSIISPISKWMIYFFFIRREGPSGKVVLLTEFLMEQTLRIVAPALSKLPVGVFWPVVAISGLFSSNDFARMVSMEHARFFRIAPTGPRLTKRALSEVNARYLTRSILNFLIRFHWYGANRRQLTREECGTVPITYLISPSMRCNLNCGGCYAAMYNREPEQDLPIEIVDKVITEGKDMGMYNVFILGGEPFIRDDMLEIYEKHSDVFFQVFTNGTLFTDELAERIAKLGNVVPLISIEGFEKETDRRRGKGVFSKIMEGMDNLHKRGVPFGYSSMVTRFNVDAVISDEFNDMLIEKGCFLGWHFLYIPVGKSPSPRLMPTPEQRLKMRELGAERIRTYKPIITIDFWNDAPFTAGCIAGGQNYFHINSNGDMEPCIFIHFATDNVKNKSLKECLNSSFFEAFRNRQPYSHNLLRPCAIIDHPHVLREIIDKHQPYPTHPESEVLVTKFATALDDYSQKVAEIFDPIWEHEYASRDYECQFFASMLRSSREKYIREQQSSEAFLVAPPELNGEEEEEDTAGFSSSCKDEQEDIVR